MHTGIARWTCAACDELRGRCGTRYDVAKGNAKNSIVSGGSGGGGSEGAESEPHNTDVDAS